MHIPVLAYPVMLSYFYLRADTKLNDTRAMSGTKYPLIPKAAIQPLSSTILELIAPPRSCWLCIDNILMTVLVQQTRKFDLMILVGFAYAFII
jgi:hypothetical protein